MFWLVPFHSFVGSHFVIFIVKDTLIKNIGNQKEKHLFFINLWIISIQLEAVQQLSHGAATMSVDATQEIHQKTVAKYGVELRSELFGLG